jgi:hypothetical protein
MRCLPLYKPTSTIGIGDELQANEQAGDARQLRDFDTQLVSYAEHEATTLPETPHVREFHAGDLIYSAASDSHPMSTALPEGHPVTRLPGQLRLHTALDGVGWDSLISEFNDAVQLKSQAVPIPILVNSNGTILAGLGRWRLAAREGSRELHCIEYQLSEDESLRFILAYHRPQRGWNAFVRIRLALTLEYHFQQKALANMRAGGKFKGSANLPEAQPIDVRQETARVAGVGARGRNVSNVKKILQSAHPSLICALQNGTLSINRALHFCQLPKAQQLEEFIQYSEQRATRKVIRQSLGRLQKNTLPNAFSALEALQSMEAVRPGSVMIQTARIPRTVILVGQDLSASPRAQGELKLR